MKKIIVTLLSLCVLLSLVACSRVNVVYCPNCDNPIEDNMNFCASCGYELQKEEITKEPENDKYNDFPAPIELNLVSSDGKQSLEDKPYLFNVDGLYMISDIDGYNYLVLTCTVRNPLLDEEVELNFSSINLIQNDKRLEIYGELSEECKEAYSSIIINSFMLPHELRPGETKTTSYIYKIYDTTSDVYLKISPSFYFADNPEKLLIQQYSFETTNDILNNNNSKINVPLNTEFRRITTEVTMIDTMEKKKITFEVPIFEEFEKYKLEDKDLIGLKAFCCSEDGQYFIFFTYWKENDASLSFGLGYSDDSFTIDKLNVGEIEISRNLDNNVEIRDYIQFSYIENKVLISYQAESREESNTALFLFKNGYTYTGYTINEGVFYNEEGKKITKEQFYEEIDRIALEYDKYFLW